MSTFGTNVIHVKRYFVQTDCYTTTFCNSCTRECMVVMVFVLCLMCRFDLKYFKCCMKCYISIMTKVFLAFSIKGEEENAGRMEWAETSVRADL